MPNNYWPFVLLMLGLLSPPLLHAAVASDTGSKEALKETAIRYTDTFTGKEFMVFESVGNEGYEQQQQFSKMTFYVAPLFRLIPEPGTTKGYQRTAYSQRGVVQYTFFVECFHPRINEQALEKVNAYYSKTKGNYVFTKQQMHHMRHGKVLIEAANLPSWVQIDPVVIGTDSPNSTVMLDAVEEFTVSVPMDVDKDFQTRLDNGLKFNFIVYFNVMNLSRLQLSWSVADIRSTSTYKQINSGGTHYVTADQVQKMTQQVAEQRKVYYYQDPEISDKIQAKAMSLFDQIRGDMQQLTAQNRQQAAELEAKLITGTGLSPNDFKPLTLMWDVYERLETTSDHQTANRIIQDAYQRSKQAYQRLDDIYQRRQQDTSRSRSQHRRDKSSRDQHSINVHADYAISDFGWSGNANMNYDENRQRSESLREGRSAASQRQSMDRANRTRTGSNTAEDRITKGYFANAEALRAYQAKTTEQKQPKVRIIGRGLNVIEKAQFEQNINAMASFVFVQPMTQAKSFMTDARIATYAKNDVPSALETLQKAAALTDAVQVAENGNINVNLNGIWKRLKVQGVIENSGADFILGTSDGRNQGKRPYNRALVHAGNDQLIINYAGDFEGGVNIQGPSTIINGSVGIGTTDPGAKLHVNGNFIRTIAYATGNGPNDGTDVGQIKSRVLRFTKAKAATKLRISYTDNFRTLGTRKACRWEIRVDGKSCPNQALIYDDWVPRDDYHHSRNVVGYCSGIAAGKHTIGVWVSNTHGRSGSDCYTGWNNSTWVLEAEEVN